MSGAAYSSVRAALESVDQGGEWDETLETVTYDDDDGDGRTTVGVVTPHFNAVTFYCVWPDQVPTEALEQTAEFVVRANTDLHTATLELDLDKQILSARSGVLLTPFTNVAPEVFGVVLAGAHDDVRRVALTHHSAVAALFLGTSALAALGMRLG